MYIRLKSVYKFFYYGIWTFIFYQTKPHFDKYFVANQLPNILNFNSILFLKILGASKIFPIKKMKK